MPRYSVTISKALDKKISAFAAEMDLSVSHAISEILAQKFEAPAQDHRHGGARNRYPVRQVERLQGQADELNISGVVLYTQNDDGYWVYKLRRDSGDIELGRPAITAAHSIRRLAQVR